MDRYFEWTCDSLPEEANLNTTAKNEHVAYIELKKCLTKELARALIISFSFKKIPVQIIIELIRFVGYCIKQEPLENWV